MDINHKVLRPMMVDCGKCEHTWAIAYLPMEVSTLVDIMSKAKCPVCAAGRRHVFINVSKERVCNG